MVKIMLIYEFEKFEIEKLKSKTNTFNCMNLMVGITQEKQV